MNKEKKGFNLAEILITLGIIGVVSAMTIPSIINKTNDTELNIRAKKAYSTLSQVILSINNDGYDLSNMDPTSADDRNVFVNELKKFYLKISECDGECVPFDGTTYRNLIGDVGDNSWVEGAQFITADGTTVMVDDWFFVISIDVNGYKKNPNQLGKDVLVFQIVKNKVLPMGANNTAFTPTSNPNYCQLTSHDKRNGFTCGVYILNGMPIPN